MMMAAPPPPPCRQPCTPPHCTGGGRCQRSQRFTLARPREARPCLHPAPGPRAAKRAVVVAAAAAAATPPTRRAPPPLAFVAGDVSAAVAAADPRGVRLYAGAAAWGRRQLTAEIADGAWVVAALPPGDVARAALGASGGAAPSADAVWEAGLAALGGDVAALAAVPVDAVAEAAEVVV